MNPEEFAMVAGLFDSPVYYEISNDTFLNGSVWCKIINDSLPQFVVNDKEMPPARYVVPAGTHIWRFPLTTSVESAQKMFTSKTVVFDEGDILRTWKNTETGAISTYTFSLPMEASPWLTIEVDSRFVKVNPK